VLAPTRKRSTNANPRLQKAFGADGNPKSEAKAPAKKAGGGKRPARVPAVRRAANSSDSERDDNNDEVPTIFQGNEPNGGLPVADKGEVEDEYYTDNDTGRKKKKRKLTITVNSAFAEGGMFAHIKAKKNKHGQYPLDAIQQVMHSIRMHWKCKRGMHQCCTPSLDFPGDCIAWTSLQIQAWAEGIVSLTHLASHYVHESHFLVA
jgi:hypothetical protein